jgi:phosphoserine phosphatase
MNDSQLLEIRDEWCREMARQAMRDAKEVDARIAAARANRLGKQSSPQVTRALDMEIAMLQRIREELESDVEDWVG